jgi:hypothetical protein
VEKNWPAMGSDNGSGAPGNAGGGGSGDVEMGGAP